MIVVIAVCFLCCFFAIVYYSPSKTDTDATAQALKEQHKAIDNQRASLEKLEAQALDNINYFTERDSKLNNEIKINRDEIKKVRNPENIIAIGRYDSDDLVRAFAELERQYYSSK